MQESATKEIEILYDGATANMNTKALTSALLAGLIRPQVADVNMVSAPIMIKEKGIILSEVKRDKTGVYDGFIKLTVKTENQVRSVAGTVFSDGKARFIRSRTSTWMPMSVSHDLHHQHRRARHDRLHGHHAREAGVNIANFQLGREANGGDAIALLYVDGPVSEEVLDKLRANPASVRSSR